MGETKNKLDLLLGAFMALLGVTVIVIGAMLLPEPSTTPAPDCSGIPAHQPAGCFR